MDPGKIVYISSCLSTGALAAFFAIILWSKTRDTAWMLVVIGTLAAYVETVHTILTMFGITEPRLTLGSVSLTTIILPNLKMGFFIAAFVVMVIRKLRYR
jgi:hypothetical protein